MHKASAISLALLLGSCAPGSPQNSQPAPAPGRAVAPLVADSCHHESAADAWSKRPLPSVPGADYAVQFNLTIDQPAQQGGLVYQGSFQANYNLNENMGGYEAGVSLRRQGGQSYRFLISSAWQEAVLWSSCGGVVQVRPLPVPLKPGQPAAVVAQAVGAHLLLAVAGQPVLDYWDTRAPILQGEAALLTDEGMVHFDGVKVQPLSAPAAGAAGPGPHTAAFSLRNWKDVPWGFDGDEPLFVFGAGAVAYEVKLMPGYHAQAFIQWYPQSYGGSAFAPTTPQSFTATQQGPKLGLNVQTTDPVTKVASSSDIVISYEPTTGMYTYAHVSNLIVPPGGSVQVDQPIDFADPDMLNAVPSASPEGPQWPVTTKWSAYQHLSGATYKQPHNHQDWYPGYGTPAWEQAQMSLLKPNGGFWVESGDAVVNPLFELMETPDRAGQFSALMCNWGFDLHMQWTPPGGLGTVIGPGTYTIHWQLSGVAAEGAQQRLAAATFATPGNLDSKWLLYTGGVGHVEQFNMTALRASPFGEYAWGDGALQDEAVGRTDKTSMRMDGPAVAGNVLGPSQYMDDLVADSDYEVSVWVKTQGVKGEGPGIILESSQYYPGVVGDNDWRHIGFVMHTAVNGSDNAQVPFLLHHSGSGHVWFDDFLVRRITPGAPADPLLDNAPRSLAAAGQGRADVTLDYSASSDAGDNTVLDLSGNGNHAARRATAAWVAEAAGKRVLSFDGAAGYVQMVGHPAVNLGAQATLLMWAKPTAAADAAGAQEMDLATGSGDPLFTRWYLQLLPWTGDWVPAIALNNVNIVDYNTTTAVLPQNRWSHVAMSYDGTQAKLYLNGALVVSGSAPGGWFQQGDSVLLGAAMVFQPTNLFAGRMGPVRIYPRVLSAAEVAAAYAAGGP